MGAIRRLPGVARVLLALLLITSGVLLAAQTEAPARPETQPERRWQLDMDASRIEFRAQQAGARFRGQIRAFTAEIQFDPADLAQSFAWVAMQTASIDSADEERDEVLQTSEWFAGNAYPEIYFVANEFEALGNNRFQTQGLLHVKGLGHRVPFSFEVREDQGYWLLNGSARLDRLALSLGTGEWADTSMIGRQVEVEVSLRARVGAVD